MSGSNFLKLNFLCLLALLEGGGGGVGGGAEGLLWARSNRPFYQYGGHISNTKLEKGYHYYVQTRHKDLFSHYNRILRKL